MNILTASRRAGGHQFTTSDEWKSIIVYANVPVVAEDVAMVTRCRHGGPLGAHGARGGLILPRPQAAWRWHYGCPASRPADVIIVGEFRATTGVSRPE